MLGSGTQWAGTAGSRGQARGHGGLRGDKRPPVFPWSTYNCRCPLVICSLAQHVSSESRNLDLLI